MSEVKLYSHQRKFVDSHKGNPQSALLCWETGTGKTLAAVRWLCEFPVRQLKVIICPKQIVQKWSNEKLPRNTRVMSREEFVRDTGLIGPACAIVVDEADQFASPLFIAKSRSLRSEALYGYIRRHTPKVLLLTATPVRSTPWNLHTLLTFLGLYTDWKKWQSEYFELVRKPFLPRPAFFPVKNWRTLIRVPLEKYANIVLLRDCVAEVPPITESSEMIQLPPYIPDPEAAEWEPMKQFVARHRYEQHPKKFTRAEEIASGFGKSVVVCHFREQMEAWGKLFEKKGWQVYQVHGGVKDPEKVIKEAQEDPNCVLLIQASIAAGFDLDLFSCMIFASMSYRVVDYVQMMGRLQRIHNLHPVHYYFLLGGKCDKGIYDTVRAGLDFVPSVYKVKQYL